MSLFRCERCGGVENTALSNWASRHLRQYDDRFAGAEKVHPLPPALCSECDPDIGRWHGKFPKRSAIGMVIATDGFLYHPSEFKDGSVRHTRPKEIVTEATPLGLGVGKMSNG